MGLGAWAFVASERRVDATTRTASADAAVDRAVALLADPRTERLRLSGSKGRIVLAVGPGDHALLVLNGLGKAPAGRSYEAWLVRRGGKVARAAVFSGHFAVVDLAGRVPRGAAVGVTLERAGGVARPTRPLRLLARRV